MFNCVCAANIHFFLAVQNVFLTLFQVTVTSGFAILVYKLGSLLCQQVELNFNLSKFFVTVDLQYGVCVKGWYLGLLLVTTMLKCAFFFAMSLMFCIWFFSLFLLRPKIAIKTLLICFWRCTPAFFFGTHEIHTCFGAFLPLNFENLILNAV